MSKLVRSENTLPFLCRRFTLKDNHILLKVYEFHEMLLWETHMFFSEMRWRCLWYVTVLLKWELWSFSCGNYTLKDNHVLLNIWISWNAFVRNTPFFLWIDKPFFGICQRLDKTKNSVPFLCSDSNLKDNHIHLKGNEFHEMLLWETHMSFCEKISHFCDMSKTWQN